MTDKNKNKMGLLSIILLGFNAITLLGNKNIPEPIMELNPGAQPPFAPDTGRLEFGRGRWNS